MKRTPPLTMRPATKADARLLHEWRNDPEARRASRNTDRVPWEVHEAWLARMLELPACMIRIVEEGGRPAGVIRAERSGDHWELSWTVAPSARGRGIGRRMLVQFASQIEGRIVATIRRDNIASGRIALAAGLRLVGEAAGPDFDQWVRD